MVAGPIKVVQMLPDLESGGVERGTLELGRYLRNAGHDSIVITGGGRMVPQLEAEGSRHIRWDVGRKSPATLKYFLPLRRLLVDEKIDILHLRSRVPAWLGYLVWKSLPHIARPRLVTTFHGFYSINAFSAVMAKGERVIAISKAVASHIRQHYRVPEDRIQVIYRGFDQSAFAPEKVSQERIDRLKKEWKIEASDGPVVLLPGRLTRLKGHDVFFESLERIKALQWTAVCAGDVDESRSYSRDLKKLLSKLGLQNRVRFTGHCDDMPAAMMISDIVVSATSTHAEAFGRVVVEAQAMGKPVIASAHGGSLETVKHGETGWLVEPSDSAKLAEALKAAVSDAETRALRGTAGRRWVERTFTVERMCRQTLDVYADLLRQPA